MKDIKKVNFVEITGNMFYPESYSEKVAPDAIFITTNGFRKSNGTCVMGRGNAKQAAELYPSVPKILGDLITKKGNHVHGLVRTDGGKGFAICSYPVKPVFQMCKTDKSNVVQHMQSKMRAGTSVPGWACVATMKEIERSAKELVSLAYSQNWKNVVIPRPGVGAGELNWDDVMPAIVAAMHKEVSRTKRYYILNVYSITFPQRSK